MSDRVHEALRPFIDALAADGYSSAIRESNGDVVFEITAGSEACAECLTPRSVMEPMIATILRQHGIEGGLRLVYPADHHDSQSN